MDCWICGQPGDSAEHMIKRSDIRAEFKEVSQNRPLYFHSSVAKNVRKCSTKDDAFKSKALLCSNCNNALSQPYDRAWERLSTALRNDPAFAPWRLIKLNKIFPHSRNSMRDVHLYFVKLFGCRIVENNIPIDIKPFSDALIQRKPHPQVYIAIGPSSFSLPGKKVLGLSEVSTMKRDDNGRHVYAQWFYHLNHVAVLIMYAEHGQRRYGLSQSWHPNTQGRLLQVAKF